MTLIWQPSRGAFDLAPTELPGGFTCPMAISPTPSATRRRFLQGAASLGVAAALPMRNLFAAAPSETVNVAIIGCGGRGNTLLGYFRDVQNARVVAYCDPDEEHLAAIGREDTRALRTADMRRLFDSSDVDAVVIATCNHWHCLAAVWAMQAGKHVYVEKPLGHTQWESEQVVAAADRFERICQVGTQQRSNPMQGEIKQFLHDDKGIGDVEGVRVNRLGVRESIGRRSAPMSPPAAVDYDLWLGPAQDIPIRREKFHYDWHWVWNTGSGEMGNWGVHVLDDVRNNVFRDTIATPSSIIAAGGRFAWNDAGETPNIHFALLDAGGIPVAVALSNLPKPSTLGQPEGPGSGYVVYCSNGQLHGHRGGAVAFDESGKQIKQFRGPGGNPRHQQNFIDAIRQGDPSILASPAQVGHDSTAWCNLINIATRLPSAGSGETSDDAAGKLRSPLATKVYKEMSRWAGKDASSTFRLGPVLTYDVAKQRWTGQHSEAANQLLRRHDRKGFEVPEIDT